MLSELRLEQWNAFVELKKSGLTKHIGVSNYNEERLKEILDADLSKPEANQVEFHPICAQIDLTRYMKENSIAPIAYSSLAPLSTWRAEEGQGGLCRDPVRPPAPHPTGAESGASRGSSACRNEGGH